MRIDTGTDGSSGVLAPARFDAARADGTLKRRLTSALVVPAALLLAVSGVLLIQISRFSEHVRWVEQSQDAILGLYSLDLAIREEESVLRGNLLARRAELPKTITRDAPRRAFAHLKTKFGSDEQQSARLALAMHQYGEWRSSFSDLQRETGHHDARLVILTSRKMEALRASLRALMRAEEGRRGARKAELAFNNRMTQSLILVLLLVASIVIVFSSRTQLKELGRVYHEALRKEREQRALVERENWIRRGNVVISEALEGDPLLDQLLFRLLIALSRYVKADLGAAFVAEGDVFRRRASFGLGGASAVPQAFRSDEGFISLSLASKQALLLEVPGDYFRVRSGTGEHLPGQLVVFAARAEGQPLAVIELAFLKPVQRRAIALIDRIADSVGLAVRSSQYKARLRELLEESQGQAEELYRQRQKLALQIEEREQILEVTRRTLRLNEMFTAALGHDLRTPLAAIMAGANVLEDHGRDARLVALRIASSALRMARMIDQLLDLARARLAGGIAVTRLRMDLGACARRIVAEALASHRGRSILLECHGEMSGAWDEERLSQVFSNLLGNALQHGVETEPIMVRIDGGRGPILRVSVHNAGMIAPELIPALFDPFRSGAPNHHRSDGLGLGLYIVDQIVRAHGGRVDVRSTAKDGTIFDLSLPRWEFESVAIEA